MIDQANAEILPDARNKSYPFIIRDGSIEIFISVTEAKRIRKQLKKLIRQVEASSL